MAKKKKRLAKFCALVGSLFSPHPKSSLFLLPCFVPAFISNPVITLIFYSGSSTVLLSRYMPAPISYSGSLAILLSCYVPIPVSCSRSSTVLLSCYIPTLVASAIFSLLCHASISQCRISALLLLLPVLGLPLPLRSLSLKTFKQSLLDELQPYMSTSPAKPLCPFPALGIYNLDNNNSLYNPINSNKLKRSFDTVFINSCLLAGNHDKKEVDLSFEECGQPNAVKFNQSW